MIRRTLLETQRATYSVDLPDSRMRDMPRPMGTGFFISKDGWFITAAHVITQNESSDGPLRNDVDKCWLMKEARPPKFGRPMCQFVNLDMVIPEIDVAILKVDFAANANKDHLRGLTGFHHLTVSKRHLEEGEPVYAFGYPLPETQVLQNDDQMTMSHSSLSPRTTSAIVAATMERTKMVSTGRDPQVYVLDKALNYGNSGGPIIATETGRVHALCSRFQPLIVPQKHIKMKDGKEMSIMIPSLYGVVSSLDDPRFLVELDRRGIALAED